MNYQEALSFIHGATRVGARDGFGRMRRMLELMGNPHKRVRFVHIAGTNGKGSTATMTANALTEAGYKTGLFISPYVVDFRERIQLDGSMIPEEELARAVTETLPFFEQVKGEIAECTEFETVTLVAMYWYAKVGCDFVVLETGIGGRDDKTNVIDPPEVAAVCSIGYDHTKTLGETLGEIARHKGGIIKPGSSAVLYCDLPEEAETVLRECCADAHVEPSFPDMGELEIKSLTAAGSEIIYKGKPYSVPLIGRHQIYNALTVITICEQLEKRGFHVGYEAVHRGIEKTRFVGRCEILCKKPLCIIDGAHNTDGAASLCRVIDEVMVGRRITIVMGMLEDKDFAPTIAMIAKKADRFIAVTPDSYRSLPAERAAEAARGYCGDVTCIESPSEGALHAVRTADGNEVIIACGSLYMIGEVKQTLLSLCDKTP